MKRSNIDSTINETSKSNPLKIRLKINVKFIQDLNQEIDRRIINLQSTKVIIHLKEERIVKERIW